MSGAHKKRRLREEGVGPEMLSAGGVNAGDYGGWGLSCQGGL